MESNKAVIEMSRGKECKGSVRFETKNDDAAATNVYVSRASKELASAQKIRVTLEVLS